MRVERIDRKGTQGAEFYGGTEQGQKLDEDLVHEALRGSDIAFGTLFERYERRMFLIAYRILRNREDAEDAVQQAFKHAFVRLNSFQGDSRFSTWMARITINEALQLLRKRRPGHTSIEGHTGSEGKPGRLEIEDAGATPEEHFNERELCGILNKAIRELRPIFRDVVQLHEIGELTSVETAQVLRLSKDTVKARTFRARRVLHKKLSQRLGFPKYEAGKFLFLPSRNRGGGNTRRTQTLAGAA